MLADPMTGAADLLDLVGERTLLAGHPRAASGPAQGSSTVFQPKELLLELAQVRLAAAGHRPILANPHFMRVAEWSPSLTAIHFSAIELTCPVPIARNVQVLSGTDLLGLAEERRLGEPNGLRRQRTLLMDGLVSVAPPEASEGLLPPGRVVPLDIAPLVAAAPSLPMEGARPVQWHSCDLETGPYNFLRLRQQPKLATTHVRVLVDSIVRGGHRIAVGFATPAVICDLGPVLRAFGAMAGPGRAAMLLVFFFGSPEELATSLAERAHASFFGDNFHCPTVRFLHGPFAAADLLYAVRAATCTVDTCFGGTLARVAEALGIPNRLIVGPDGRFDAWRDSVLGTRGILWDQVFEAETLSARQHKADRGAERALLAALSAML